MILEVTISGTVYYIDTDLILYAYDDSGLKFVYSEIGINYNPNAEVFESNSIQSPSLPTYADFVLSTANSKFIEVSNVLLGTICINLNRIQKLEDIGGTDTNLIFNKQQSVETDTAIGTLLPIINSTVMTPLRYADVDLVSDGSGVVTLPTNYITGTWRVTLRGALVRKTDISETGANELTFAGTITTRAGDFINVTYNY